MSVTERNLERWAATARSAVRDLEASLRDIPDDLSAEGQKIRRRLESSLKDARKTCERLEKSTLASLHGADETLHEKPYPFIGAAFGIGVLVGLLVVLRP